MGSRDLTLSGALAAGARGELHEWLQAFLRSPDGLNISLANLFEEIRPHYEGPVPIALASLTRIAGPEEGMPWPAPPIEWEANVLAKVASIEGGWEPPPLIAPRLSLALSDGNRRHEALRRCGRVEYWTILFSESAPIT